ncbi:class I SAM-dependent methyltransferase [Halarcobacter sp.]|uniref:class I SAM-dependent methyltransferase n=1 Tax=Halarcobacter sp. TaxID=2321133 RepID=UPI0029F5406B|nr:class I SAM-dependent methyltransferase [Halarcobacter sp.]
MNDNWKVWDNMPEYGDNFHARITGEKNEMESSKSLAHLLQEIISKDDLILDVGCGAGHYLKSLDNILKKPFNYHGVDATNYYIKLANKAYSNFNLNTCRKKEFSISDIYELNIEDEYSNITICNNVLLHLPEIDKALAELVRVTKKTIIIRTLVGDSSFRIKQIREEEEYNEVGEPINFHFFNIYSKTYFNKLAEKYSLKIQIIPDTNFDPKNIGKSNYEKSERPFDLTTIQNGYQVNKYIISPWCFIKLEKKNV